MADQARINHRVEKPYDGAAREVYLTHHIRQPHALSVSGEQIDNSNSLNQSLG